MVPGYPLNPGGYTVTTRSPDHVDPVFSNRLLALKSRGQASARKRKEAKPKRLAECL
jgi:hypothetical protein